MKMLLVLSTALLSLASQARTVYADQYTEINTRYLVNQPDDCVQEYLTPVSRSNYISRRCHVDRPLSLTWSNHDYPNLSMNPHRVEIWVGSVAKETTSSTRYLRELVDSCHGRIISRLMTTDVETNSESFSVRNPNLDPAISESFMTVPMTKAEAAAEMKAALLRCQTN